MPKRPAARLEPPKLADGSPYRHGTRATLTDGTTGRPLYCRPAADRDHTAAAWLVLIRLDTDPPVSILTPPATIERIHP